MGYGFILVIALAVLTALGFSVRGCRVSWVRVVGFHSSSCAHSPLVRTNCTPRVCTLVSRVVGCHNSSPHLACLGLQGVTTLALACTDCMPPQVCT